MKVTPQELISQLDELLEANREYTEETKNLRAFIRTKMAETLQHGIEVSYQPMTDDEYDAIEAIINKYTHQQEKTP